MTHKRNLKIDTRFDLKNQNRTTENIVVQKAWLQWFMLSWLFCICFWKFKHKQFSFLTNFWCWFYSNHMCQLIMIIFLKNSVQLLPGVAPECTLLLCDLSFFFYFVFSTDSFCPLFLTLQTTEIHNLIIFFWRI